MSFPALAADPASTTLDSWARADIRPVASATDRHTIHSYFNACPESPDGKYVLFYTSNAGNGEYGDLRLIHLPDGTETVIATGVVTEDAHRAACQQWVNNGKTIIYHDCREGHWTVVAVDLRTLKSRVLALDRQVGFGSPTQPWAPVYGCHWNPGPHRDLEFIHVETGEIRTVVTVNEVIDTYRHWIESIFHSLDISLFFPVLSPDGERVLFKLSRPCGKLDFRSPNASIRDGKIIYDLKQKRLLRITSQWGHPSWHPDSAHIFELGGVLIHAESGAQKKLPSASPTNHPSIGPNGLFVTDANVGRHRGQPDVWAVLAGGVEQEEFVVIDQFRNTRGAESWRKNHPHPVFNADGRRIYYNVNEGPWTRLMVAEISPSE